MSYPAGDPFRTPSGEGGYQQSDPVHPPAYGAGAPGASGGAPHGAYGGGPVGGNPYIAYGGYGGLGGFGPVGRVRSTGIVILLSIVTFGFYALYWWYITHAELRDHTGEGMGGGIALLIAIIFSPILAFTMPAEIERAYQRRGLNPPVSVLTGLWSVPGFLIIIGPLVWLIKVNGALNSYWRSLGAVG